MLFDWNDTTIRWYTSAEEYTGFFRNIAAVAAPMLSDCGTMCDIGCGLGLADLELARTVGKIFCVDISSAAIDWLRQACARRNINNIETLETDCAQLTGEWDAIFMSFFFGMEALKILPRCKKAIVVVSEDTNPELFPSKFRTQQKNNVAQEEALFRQAGAKYRLTRVSFEFGQPFVSMDEARAYVRSYARGISGEELDGFLRKRLVPGERAPYSLYLPRMKSVGVFELEGGLR